MYIKKRTFAVVLVLTALLMLAAGLLLGRQWGQRTEVSFYARVLENNGASLLVEGIPENDVNHRGQFTVSLKSPGGKPAVTDPSGSPAEFSALTAGREVQVVYDGIVLDSYPAQITSAYRIHLLE